MAKQKVQYPCKCKSTDTKHTKEDGGDDWTRYVCSSCGKVKFAWRSDATKESKGK